MSNEKMKKEDLEIFNALKFNESKGYYYYIVSTSVRRSGEMKISINKYNKLKSAFEKLNLTTNQ